MNKLIETTDDTCKPGLSVAPWTAGFLFVSNSVACKLIAEQRNTPLVALQWHS